ncbi:MAG: IMP dehydrogenase [Candidatus Niyogibacteria bacterium]|nr:IMP dehydrogenase [Candidatus Niyogibacteria bacterium]
MAQGFVEKIEKAPEEISYDDVLICPRYSEISPSEVDTKSPFSRSISLTTPIVSSPMDSVTEHLLAIGIACMGGLGIIHKNLSIADQVEEVAKVKRWQSGKIVNPQMLRPNQTIGEARRRMEHEGISGFLVVNSGGKLVGLLTRRDFDYDPLGDGVLIGDVMTSKDEGKLILADEQTTMEQAQEILWKHRIEKLPIVDADFRPKGLFTKKDIRKRRQFPNATHDAHGRLCVGAAVGATGDFLERAKALVEAGVDVIVVDASLGHTKNVGEAVRALKKLPEIKDVVAGNIVTADAARFLMDAGADGLRVGIGPGSICTTRMVTGYGRPQLSAVADVADAAGGIVPVIADGGIKVSGDIVKAFAGGADSIMIGNLLARTDESAGDIVQRGSQRYKKYRGMGSKAVLEAGGDRYPKKSVPEGEEGLVPCAGPLADVFRQLEGGLRQAMGGLGCRMIEELRSKTFFIRITPAGLQESHVHDIWLETEPPPNFRNWNQ